MQDSKLGSLRHQFASRLNAHSQTDWAIEDQAKKTWTQQPVPILSEQSAYLTSLPVGFHTWLWRYTCLLFISMLWHRQAVLESKKDMLYSSAQCRIRSWELYYIHNSSSILPLDIFLKKTPMRLVYARGTFDQKFCSTQLWNSAFYIKVPTKDLAYPSHCIYPIRPSIVDTIQTWSCLAPLILPYSPLVWI